MVNYGHLQRRTCDPAARVLDKEHATGIEFDKSSYESNGTRIDPTLNKDQINSAKLAGGRSTLANTHIIPPCRNERNPSNCVIHHPFL